MWICPNCEEVHEDNFDTCCNCSYVKENDDKELQYSQLDLYNKANKLCAESKYDEAVKVYKRIIDNYPDSSEADYSKLHIEAIKNAVITNGYNISSNIPFMLTTAHSLDGYFVKNTIEIITAECCYGINIFKDMLTGITDTIG